MYKAHISALQTTSLNFPPWTMSLPKTPGNDAFFSITLVAPFMDACVPIA